MLYLSPQLVDSNEMPRTKNIQIHSGAVWKTRNSPKSDQIKTTISLAPAHIKKTGPIFDLAMALCFLKSSNQISFSNNGDIFIASTDGSTPPINISDGTSIDNKVSLPNSPAVATWSPDGTKIAFVSERDGGREIYVMNSDGSEQTRLMTGDGNSPAWSPDGSQIAFESRREGDNQIYLMNSSCHPSTSNPTYSTSSPTATTRPVIVYRRLQS
jgi:Tol biopolymer transport system component